MIDNLQSFLSPSGIARILENVLPKDTFYQENISDIISKAHIHWSKRQNSENQQLSDIDNETHDEQDLIKMEQVANTLYQEGDYEKARYNFEALVVIEPANPRYLYGLGCCRQALGNYEAAFLIYSLSMLLSSTTADSYIRAAECCIKMNNLEQAETLLLTAKEHLASREDMQDKSKSINKFLDKIALFVSKNEVASNN